MTEVDDIIEEMRKKAQVDVYELIKPTPTISSPMVGWICPNCKAGLSPFTPRCGCKDR